MFILANVFPCSTKVSVAPVGYLICSGKKVDPIQKRDGIHLNLKPVAYVCGAAF